MGRSKTPLADRFWQFVLPEPNSGCWLWAGTMSGNGYGRIRDDRDRQIQAHRAAYELFVGPVSKGLDLDHLCRVRCCVNPDHLDLVTVTENVMRGFGIPANNARKTHCKRGHLLAGNNLRIRPDGRRVCRTCAYLYNLDHKRGRNG